MTLRTLPQISAPQALAGREWEVREDALARFDAGVRAAEADDAATISIYDQIGATWDGEGVTAKRIAAALRKIGSGDVTVSINSPGGDYFEGLAIYNLLRDHPARVTTRVVGLAASAASVIALAADRVEVAAAGFLMVHNAWGLVIGNRHDLTEAAALLGQFDGAMAELYAARAGVELEEAAGWMDAETFFSGAEAVEAGLADGLLPADAIAHDDEAQASGRAALRRVEQALAKDGASRRERRALLSELTRGAPGAASRAGTPSAAGDATPSAGDVAAALRGLIQNMRV